MHLTRKTQRKYSKVTKKTGGACPRCGGRSFSGGRSGPGTVGRAVVFLPWALLSGKRKWTVCDGCGFKMRRG